MYRLRTDYFEIESWKKWYLNLVIEDSKKLLKTADLLRNKKYGATRKSKERERKLVERAPGDVAFEVLEYRKRLVNFGGKRKHTAR